MNLIGKAAEPEEFVNIRSYEELDKGIKQLNLF